MRTNRGRLVGHALMIASERGGIRVDLLRFGGFAMLATDV
jgi:hypothetical protein